MVTMCTEGFMRGSRVKRMLSHALGRIWSWRALDALQQAWRTTSSTHTFLYCGKHVLGSVVILVIKL